MSRCVIVCVYKLVVVRDNNNNNNNNDDDDHDYIYKYIASMYASMYVM